MSKSLSLFVFSILLLIPVGCVSNQCGYQNAMNCGPCAPGGCSPAACEPVSSCGVESCATDQGCGQVESCGLGGCGSFGNCSDSCDSYCGINTLNDKLVPGYDANMGSGFGFCGNGTSLFGGNGGFCDQGAACGIGGFGGGHLRGGLLRHGQQNMPPEGMYVTRGPRDFFAPNPNKNQY